MAVRARPRARRRNWPAQRRERPRREPPHRVQRGLRVGPRPPWRPIRTAVDGRRASSRPSSRPASRATRGSVFGTLGPRPGDRLSRGPPHRGSRQSTWPEISPGLRSPQRLDVPVLAVWLAKAQSLGRLVPTRHGLCPTVVLLSQVDASSSRPHDEDAARSYGGAEGSSSSGPLRVWLRLTDRFHVRQIGDVQEEIVRLSAPSRHRACSTIPFALARKIQEEAWGVVQAVDSGMEETREPARRTCGCRAEVASLKAGLVPRRVPAPRMAGGQDVLIDGVEASDGPATAPERLVVGARVR